MERVWNFHKRHPDKQARYLRLGIEKYNELMANSCEMIIPHKGGKITWNGLVVSRDVKRPRLIQITGRER